MDASTWNERSSGPDLGWPSEPNRWVVAELSGSAPGTALDLACGQGRNALWLADQGWEVVAVDADQAWLDRARDRQRAMEERDLSTLAITWECDDVTNRPLPSSAYDLVLLSYVQLEEYDRREVVRACVQAVAPGGTLLVVAHDASNLEEGYGGPQAPGVLYSAADLENDMRDHLSSGAFALDRSGRVAREVETDEGARVAWDVVVRVTRRDMGQGGFSFGG